MKNRNIFWGIIFICAAAFILLNNFGYFHGLNGTGILITILLVYCIIKNIRYLNFFGILIPIALLCIVYEEPLHLTSITPFPVLFAAVCGSIGLSFIFPRHPAYDGHHHGYHINKKTVDHVSDSDINCTVCFSGTTKYIDTPDFRQGCFKCSFGSLKVFFDHANITADSADIYIDTSFGETELYLPREWNVKVQASASFGDITEIHKISQNGFPVVTIRGNVSFGDCKIYYI